MVFTYQCETLSLCETLVVDKRFTFHGGVFVRYLVRGKTFKFSVMCKVFPLWIFEGGFCHRPSLYHSIRVEVTKDLYNGLITLVV